MTVLLQKIYRRCSADFQFPGNRGFIQSLPYNVFCDAPEYKCYELNKLMAEINAHTKIKLKVIIRLRKRVCGVPKFYLFHKLVNYSPSS